MPYIATPHKEYKIWDYILGDYYKDLSIAVSRYYYLYNLNIQYPIKLSLRDAVTDKWTKWQEFPGMLWQVESGSYGITKSYLTAAIDVHRSVLPNEVVVESDYPTYEENYEAARLVGRMIEEKGFEPLYYFSGNKSIHIHIFFEWDCLKEIDVLLQDQLRIIFKDSKTAFQKKFIEWLRAKMISCWDTNAKKFDSDLIRPTHLIRAELSRNKIGYKTFLGYSYKDLSFVPYICNEENRIYPKLGEIKLSSPKQITEIIQEFIDDIEKDKKRKKKITNYGNLSKWVNPENKKIRECVKMIMEDDFKKIGDGYQRSMFILINELKNVYGKENAGVVMHDWNSRMGFPIKDEDINYRLKQKAYTLSCSYIHNFLKDLGVDMSRCKHKVYK